MLLRFADGRFGRVASIGFRDGGAPSIWTLSAKMGRSGSTLIGMLPSGGAANGLTFRTLAIPSRCRKAVIREWQAMAAAIENDSEVPVSSDYGRHVISCIEAAMISSREQRDVIVAACRLAFQAAPSLGRRQKDRRAA
jgi:phthalate 4,5-cis-dihydrodiol dehydrogenase